jgi:hypothetical protein
VLSLAGVFIGTVALYAALTESAAVRQQTAAAVWPFVQFSIETVDTGEEARFAMSLTNAGVGPARLRGMRFVVAGEPVGDWAEAVRRVGGEATSEIQRNFVNNRVLRPEESVVILGTADPMLARRFQSAVTDPANYVSYCYCSMFDDCWLADSRRDLQTPESVEQCPELGEAAWRH